MQNTVAWNNNDTIEVSYPSGCVVGLIDNACYVGKIYLPDAQGLQPDTIIHEYGHFVLSRYLDNAPIINACLLEGFTHYIGGLSNETCAWNEGWANFFQMAVQSAFDPLYFPNYNSYDFETPADPDLAIDPPPYDIWEATVTAILWDIFDGPSTVEPFYSFDTIQDGFNNFNNGIWQISTTEPLYGQIPDTLNDFYSAWNENRDYSCAISAIYQHHGLEYPPFRYTLTRNISPPGFGTVSVSPTPNCPENTYSSGTEVTLIAVPSPASDYAFFSWTGAGYGIDPGDGSSTIMTMNRDYGVTANFVVPEMEIFIVQGGDDAGGPNPQWAGGCTDESAGLSEIYLGHCEDGSPIISGFRFQDVGIPDGATINAAHLEFTVDGNYTRAIDVEFQGELVDNPVSYNDISWPSDRSPLTNAVVPWYIGDRDWWMVEYIRSSPGLSIVIQEIINQPGWTSGNAISLIVQPSSTGTDSRRVFAWERDGTLQSARLQIWYDPPVGLPPAPTNLTAVYEDGWPDPTKGKRIIPLPIPYVALSWQPDPPPKTITFNVYRSSTYPVPVDAAHRIVAGWPMAVYEDYNGQEGDWYVVTAVDSNGESLPSKSARAAPPCNDC